MSFVYNSINVEHILSSGNNSQEEASNPLEIKKENKLVRETVEVPYYKNMDELAKGNSKSVFLEQNASATQHASILINETKYGKMSVNSEYIGWIDEKYFENRPSKVIERKNIMHMEQFQGATITLFGKSLELILTLILL